MIYRATDSEIAQFNAGLLPTLVKQHDFSKLSLGPKKEIFRKTVLLYSNINQEEGKLRDRLIRTMVRDLIALDYQNEMSVNFASTNIYDNEEMENMNYVAKNDFIEMKKEEYMYFLKRCKYVTGVGIEVLLGWNDKRQRPDYTVINSMNARPDPSARNSVDISSYDFYAFDGIMTMDELIEYGAWNLKSVTSGYQGSDLQMNDANRNTTRAITTTTTDMNNIAVSWHYTVYNGVPVQVLTTNNYGTIQGVRPVIPLMEKNNGYDMKFPIALEFWSPLNGDPFGESVSEIAEDAQKLRQLFKNLKKIKATNQALGGKTFLDKRILTANRNELMKNNIGRQFIGADSLNGQAIANSIYTLPEEQVGPDVYSLENQLFDEAQYNLAIDNQTRGMQTNKTQTATESQIIQQGSNLKLLLNSRLTAIGQKQFWTLWYLFYNAFFDTKSKKFAMINKGLWSNGQEFRRKDLISAYHPVIEVKSKAEIEAEEDKQRLYFFNAYNTMMADPSTPAVSKRFLKRKYLRLSKSTRSEIEIECPLEPEEVKAKEDLLLLNRDHLVPIEDMNEDHLTYLCIYRTGIQTKANQIACKAREQAYILSGQMAQQRQSMNQNMGNAQGQANASNAQMTAMNMQQMQQQL